MNREWCNLSWLPDPPDDFGQRCKAVNATDPGLLRGLAGYRLNDAQLHRLANQCARFSTAPAGFESIRLGILSNANTDFLGPALRASALRYGVWLDVVSGAMGEMATAAHDPGSVVNAFRPDFVLVGLTWQSWPQSITAGDEAAAMSAVENLKGDIELIAAGVEKNSGAGLIVQTMPQAPLSLFGSLERRMAGTRQWMIDRFNGWLRGSDLPMVDVAALADTIGLAAWHNPGQWHWAKLPFSQTLIPLYADYVARYLGALRGRSRKALVLDLDNTLWGGVIGDDGIDGIELGQGSPRGEAFLAVQQIALALQRRGIVLAVCSKNEDSTARLPFRQHREQILKEDHIAVFQANWADKASNLAAIAKALDLTPDALVFLDDNPAERQIVRQELPAVAVPEIPDNDPALWPQILSAAGYFEAASFTDADLNRAEQYSVNARRETLKVHSRDIGDYLKALEMEMEITAFDGPVVARVAQLINRSNQYNLTTRRYTESQVAALNTDPSMACFSARLRDRFGDNGIISIVICRDEGSDWYIDTWLMSCRVLGRQVERSLLNHITAMAKAAGKAGLKGHYIPSPKNSMVERHYETLGFAHVSGGPGEETVWRLELADFVPQRVPIAVVSAATQEMRA